ncbi:serpin family protein [Candidatus Dojkabacteria bacterium]|nr:serpin family protein [Candidatus Dojkabacteria bacterium]
MDKTRKILLIIAGSVLLTTLTVAIILAWKSKSNDSKVNEINSTDGVKVVEASNEFGLDLLTALYTPIPHHDAHKYSIFISPLSIEIALALAANGANGETQEQMLSALGLNDIEINKLNEQFKILQEYLTDAEYLDTANAIWLSEEYHLKDEFVNVAKNYFTSVIDGFDPENPLETALAINNWAADNTNDKIKEVVTANLLSNIRMILANAVYFKQDWQYQFNPDNTLPNQKFTPDWMIDSDPVGDVYGPFYVDLMALYDQELNYYEDNTMQIVELPYAKENLVMYVVLPTEGNTVSSLLKTWRFESISDLEAAMELNEGTVLFPKFEQKYSVFLNHFLNNMGMELAFSDSADFSGITDDCSLAIDLVKHDSYIKVDEEGTEAAAVTTVGFDIVSVETDEFYFKADHTFMYMIVDKSTDTMLFVGIFNDN